jgi:hypothetical protein
MPYAEGTCTGCGGEPRPGRRQCQACADRRAAAEAAQREGRRERGECLVCGAPVARSKTLDAGRKRVRSPARYCRAHLAYYAERRRKSLKAH